MDLVTGVILNTEHETHITAIVQAGSRIKWRPILFKQVNQFIHNAGIERLYILDDKDYRPGSSACIFKQLLDAKEGLLLQKFILNRSLLHSVHVLSDFLAKLNATLRLVFLLAACLSRLRHGTCSGL